MARIAWIEDDDATGEIADVYDTTSNAGHQVIINDYTDLAPAP